MINTIMTARAPPTMETAILKIGAGTKKTIKLLSLFRDRRTPYHEKPSKISEGAISGSQKPISIINPVNLNYLETV